MSEKDEIEAQSYKSILTDLCGHLSDIAEALNDIGYQLRELTGTQDSGTPRERSYLRTIDIGRD